MEVFISSASCISPQKTFNTNDILTAPVEYTGQRLPVIAPDYKEYIDVKLLRRMSHAIRMGVTAAKDCLNKAGANMPGAIITGTALGCIEDTATFLTRIIEMNEEMLSPTAFVQSTHNTVAAQVALSMECHNYNNTFVHKGISFESALIDAIMLLQEGETDNVLAGGIEELTDASFKILSRMGLYRRNPVSNLSLFAGDHKGTIAGEGVAFFLLSDKASPNALAVLKAVKTLYKPADIKHGIETFLRSNGLDVEDVDLVITGKNGDIKNDSVYNELKQSLFKNNDLVNYKQLCGEYSTSSSFALWLAANCIKANQLPPVIVEQEINRALKSVLIYNHYQNKYHSLMLVSAI